MSERDDTAASLRPVSAELRRMFETDQADRSCDPSEIDWTVVAPRDQARRERAVEMMQRGLFETASDFYHAAMILQHGQTIEDFATAFRLASRAVELDPSHGAARWLAAAARDRELMTRGQPQRFGTQFQLVDGRWALYEVDPSVTDDERAAWNVPSLAEARIRAEQMNAPRPTQ